MKIGYARVSKCDGSQVLDLQIDALIREGVNRERIYIDKVSGVKEQRPGLTDCIKSLREGDSLVIYKLDRLARSVKHLIEIVNRLNEEKIGLVTLDGLKIDTSTAHGKLIFHVFSAIAEFERDLIRERTIAGLNAARARGRRGGRPKSLTMDQIKVIQRAMKDKTTVVTQLARAMNVSTDTIYNYVSPSGELRSLTKL